ncbi:MAG: hypothetical protein IKQ46_10640 [Bacteroidales bacterium]|nr:hypothetical protein [Bacteroidales bacterium]
MQKLTMYRLIADENKLITDGTVTGKVIDVAPNRNPDDFYEIDEPEEEPNREEEE